MLRTMSVVGRDGVGIIPCGNNAENARNVMLPTNFFAKQKNSDRKPFCRCLSVSKNLSANLRNGGKGCVRGNRQGSPARRAGG